MKNIDKLIIIIYFVASWVAEAKSSDKSPYVIRPKRSIDVTAAHGLATETRLQKTVTPIGYKLELEPYIDDLVFKGRVKINVTWVEESAEVSLHCSHDLQISDVEVRVQNSSKENGELTNLQIKLTDMNPKKPIYTIHFKENVAKGTNGYINIHFKGNLETTKTEAFFKTSFEILGGKKSDVLATQLRPNNARRMFPCFDEPGYKAYFDLSVIRPTSMIALSNTPLKLTEEIVGEPFAVWDHFERTPIMSTFTLGLVIGDIRALNNTKATVNDKAGNNIDIRIWGREHFLPALDGAMEKVMKTFSEISAFWNIPLPLKKLDLVALPNYLGVKPADNWGLIVFKESELNGKGYFQIAQEMMYQWLGAYATPAWWTDAHLNKALVGYLSAATALKIDNGSELDGKWPMTILYSLYYEFSKRYPHSRITGMKQETACSKIELLFRMFNYTLGQDAFRDGMRMFIQDKKFQTFNASDVWQWLNTAAHARGRVAENFSVAVVAQSWIDEDRLPVINIERNYKSKTAIVKQKVYLRERPHDVPGQDKMLWWIPLVVIKQTDLNFANSTPTVWMQQFRDVNLLDLPDDNQFIIVNPEEIGPFPVNYDQLNWNMIADFLMSNDRLKIPTLTRAKLLHDAWNLAYAGDLSFATAFNMTLFLKKERNHLVWDPVFTMIDHIGKHIDASPVYRKFEIYVRRLLAPLYEELTSQDSVDSIDSWRSNLRSLCKTFLCKAGYKPCIEEAQNVYRKWMEAENPDDGNPIPNQFVCPVFKWGTEEEWEFGLQRIINFPTLRKLSERTYLLKTLAGCPLNTNKMERLLNITVIEQNGNFTDNDMFLIFSMLTGGSKGYTTLFNFLQANWVLLKQRFENKTNLWDHLISSATSPFTTKEGLEIVKKFYSEHQGEFGSAEHIVEKSLKNIQEETKWSDENLPIIEKWLNGNLQATHMDDNKFMRNPYLTAGTA